MKKLFTILLVLISIEMKAQILLDTFHYDSTKNELLIYNKTFTNTGYDRIEFNLPFADHFYIDGMHVEFTISKENILHYFFRNSTVNYFDLEVNLYDGTHLGWPNDPHSPYIPVSTTGIIRIVINK